MERSVEPHEGAEAGIIEEDRVGGLCGIEALAHEIELLLLEGRRTLVWARDIKLPAPPSAPAVQSPGNNC
jgi:hypothetical protein